MYHSEPIGLYDWQELAEELLSVLGDEVQDQGAPSWIRVFEDPDSARGFSVEASPEPGALVGWTAPAECLAVGTVATGTMVAGESDLHDHPAPSCGAPLGDGSRIRLCCVVGRSGEIGWRVEVPGGGGSSFPPAEGRLLDCLKRCVGLPTSPPDAPASELHAAAWAVSILEAAVVSPDRLTWSDVTRLHPLARLLEGDLDGVGPGAVAGDPGQEDLTALIRIAAHAWTWSEIRHQAATGNLTGLVDSGMAAWMDDGMFSRWLLCRIPSVDQLLGALQPLLAPSALHRLEDVVRGAG